MYNSDFQRRGQERRLHRREQPSFGAADVGRRADQTLPLALAFPTIRDRMNRALDSLLSRRCFPAHLDRADILPRRLLVPPRIR